MGIFFWVVFGAIVGWVASMIMGTNAEQGAITNIIVGIVGALIGGFIMNTFGNTPVTGFNLHSFMVALLGAVILIWLVKLVR